MHAASSLGNINQNSNSLSPQHVRKDILLKQTISMATAKTQKPRLFVGSSTESLDIAYAVQENLEHDAEITVWPQGIFELSKTTLESLLRVLVSFDFGVFVFAPDDILKIRRQKVSAVRDNVVFELGMFLAKLGPERTFIIAPRNNSDLRFPTDLVGLTPGTFDAQRSDGNLVAALGPVCSKVRRSLRSVGKISKKTVRRNAARPIAVGLSQELKIELSKVVAERDAKLEQILQRFGKSLTKTLENQDEGEIPESSERDLVSKMTKVLPPLAFAFMRAIRSAHLTLEQYQLLLKSNRLGSIVRRLRSAGVLIPLEPAVKDEDNKPVYWFPSGRFAKLIFTYLEPKGVSKSDVETVKNELKLVGYHYAR